MFFFARRCHGLNIQLCLSFGFWLRGRSILIFYWGEYFGTGYTREILFVQEHMVRVKYEPLIF